MVFRDRTNGYRVRTNMTQTRTNMNRARAGPRSGNRIDMTQLCTDMIQIRTNDDRRHTTGYRARTDYARFSSGT
jgi:hypothetical protein